MRLTIFALLPHQQQQRGLLLTYILYVWGTPVQILGLVPHTGRKGADTQTNRHTHRDKVSIFEYDTSNLDLNNS